MSLYLRRQGRALRWSSVAGDMTTIPPSFFPDGSRATRGPVPPRPRRKLDLRLPRSAKGWPRARFPHQAGRVPTFSDPRRGVTGGVWSRTELDDGPDRQEDGRDGETGLGRKDLDGGFEGGKGGGKGE